MTRPTFSTPVGTPQQKGPIDVAAKMRKDSYRDHSRDRSKYNRVERETPYPEPFLGVKQVDDVMAVVATYPSGDRYVVSKSGALYRVKQVPR